MSLNLNDNVSRQLFVTGNFKSASGLVLPWKVECDALSEWDWDTLALMALPMLPPFGKVEAVMNGGLNFGSSLMRHRTPHCETLLIADDVFTTGGSIEKQRAGRDAVGIVAFSRGQLLPWVKAVWQLGT